jgi:putative transposase
VPRDRDGTFEPQTVPKHARRLEGFNAAVLSLYAKGLTTGEIQAHLEEIYDTSISRYTISKITDAVVEELTEWQTRPLESIYPVILIDAIVVKIRDGAVANRPVYVAMAVNLDGQRDVLGMWVGPSGGAYASKKHWGQITKQMRQIYTAPTVDAATDRFADFAADWRDQYPAMIASWERAWDEFVPFLAFPPELRKLVYTTNAIESLNARFRRATRQRGHFPTEQAALKILYLAIRQRENGRANPTGQIFGWKTVLNALTIHYGERLTNPGRPADQ